MFAPDLFGYSDPRPDPPIARNTDPWTSHVAARRYLESGKRETVHKKIVRSLLNRDGRTAREVSRDCGVPTAHKRMPELERMELIGRGEARICTVTGETAITWWIGGGNGNAQA